jgi:hypothetical protein
MRLAAATSGLAMLCALAACKEESAQLDSGTKIDTTSNKGDLLAADSKAKADSAKPDAKQTSPDLGICGDPAALAAEALAKGTKVLAGVKLTTSTPLADIVANATQYQDKVLRIEGFVVEICQKAGCYVTLQDLAKKNKLNLKVTDGTVDFRTVAKLHQYAVGEGPFNAQGEHGGQVFIEKHGAMLGPTICPQ